MQDLSHPAGHLSIFLCVNKKAMKKRAGSSQPFFSVVRSEHVSGNMHIQSSEYQCSHRNQYHNQISEQIFLFHCFNSSVYCSSSDSLLANCFNEVLRLSAAQIRAAKANHRTISSLLNSFFI